MTQELNNSASEAIKRKLQNVVYMDKVTSVEHYLEIGCEPKQVLRSISLDIKRGELWAITGGNKYELKLLLEIIANIKPYQNGKCELTERGMLRHKRTILPHVFYIGNTSMIYHNMNVLEFLMFATANNNFDVISQQERIFEQLISFGLGDVSLTSISTLTPQYKAIILLLVGAYSNSQLIIVNIPNLIFDKAQRSIIRKINEYLRSMERTLILSATDFYTIDDAFDHTAVLHDGRLIYKGTTEELKSKNDKIILTIEDSNVKLMKEKLSGAFPLYDFDICDEILTIRNRTAKPCDAKILYEKIISFGYTPERMKVNMKTVKNAYEELVRQYDLQK